LNLPGYNIYQSPSSGLPINYATPVAVISSLATTTWTSGALAAPGDYWFAVRAFNAIGEEQNIDAVVEVVLAAGGADATNTPGAPTGLRALPFKGGGIKVEWSYHPVPAHLPTGFHIYTGVGTPNYASPAGTVAWGAQVANNFVANLTGYTDGVTYAVVVRAYNASGEETNTNAVSVTASASGPTGVLSLTGAAIV
jgi:hypothetical protein